MADAGYALRIDFRPLVATPIKLPSNALFAVLHSGVEMNKAQTTYYNERVVECRLAAQIICKKLGKHPTGSDDWYSVRTLKQAQLLAGANNPEGMLPLVERLLKREPYSREELCEILGVTDADLAQHSLNSNTQWMKQFHLQKRARHVYSEVNRVLEFERICAEADKHGENTVVARLGEIMNGSHRSCAEDYECSCPELDSTVKECIAAGCIGARLTGAGWGGCVVALVEKERKAETAKNLKVLFWSEPSAGIQIV